MGPLRLLVICLAVVAMSGTAYHVLRTPEPPPERPDPTAGPWGRAEHRGYTLPLPHAWLGNPQPVPGRGMSFLGPEVDGFRPHVILYLQPTDRSLDEWTADQRMPPGARVVSTAPTTLAGVRTQLVVYDTERKNRTVRVMEWAFVRDGHGGIFRAVAPLAEYRARYRPFFFRIARGLRFDSR